MFKKTPMKNYLLIRDYNNSLNRKNKLQKIFTQVLQTTTTYLAYNICFLIE